MKIDGKLIKELEDRNKVGAWIYISLFALVVLATYILPFIIFKDRPWRSEVPMWELFYFIGMMFVGILLPYFLDRWFGINDYFYKKIYKK